MDGDWHLHVEPKITEPRIKPGQIWLVAHPPEGTLSGPERDAIANADVIVYQRSLAPCVARHMELGSYAEPLSQNGGIDARAIAARALEFAALGWSVVQLVEAHPGWRARVRAAAASLTHIERTGGSPVVLLHGQRVSNGSVADLPELLDDFAEDDFPTVVFGPLAGRALAPSVIFTANGLAG